MQQYNICAHIFSRLDLRGIKKKVEAIGRRKPLNKPAYSLVAGHIRITLCAVLMRQLCKNMSAVLLIMALPLVNSLELPRGTMIGDIEDDSGIELECSLTNGQLIRECVFKSPKDASVSGRLEDGGRKCVHKIASVSKDEHFGTWKCDMKTNKDEFLSLVSYIEVSDVARVKEGIRLPTHLKPKR